MGTQNFFQKKFIEKIFQKNLSIIFQKLFLFSCPKNTLKLMFAFELYNGLVSWTPGFLQLNITTIKKLFSVSEFIILPEQNSFPLKIFKVALFSRWTFLAIDNSLGVIIVRNVRNALYNVFTYIYHWIFVRKQCLCAKIFCNRGEK